MAKKQQIYIVMSTETAMITLKKDGTPLLAENAPNRRSVDGSKVIMQEDDFKFFQPVINEDTGELALTTEQKVTHVGGIILSHTQAIKMVQSVVWNEEKEGGSNE